MVAVLGQFPSPGFPAVFPGPAVLGCRRSVTRPHDQPLEPPGWFHDGGCCCLCHPAAGSVDLIGVFTCGSCSCDSYGSIGVGAGAQLEYGGSPPGDRTPARSPAGRAHGRKPGHGRSPTPTAPDHGACRRQWPGLPSLGATASARHHHADLPGPGRIVVAQSPKLPHLEPLFRMGGYIWAYVAVICRRRAKACDTVTAPNPEGTTTISRERAPAAR